MTSIKMLHVSARGCHLQEIFQIKEIQALLEKIINSQTLKKFPTSYGTQMFITAFTNSCLKY
jgi:hypothetical protein